MEPATEHFMNYAMTSKYLSIPVNTLYSLVSKRLIPHHRPPYANSEIVRFLKSELDAWLTQPIAVKRSPAKIRKFGK